MSYCNLCHGIRLSGWHIYCALNPGVKLKASSVYIVLPILQLVAGCVLINLKPFQVVGPKSSIKLYKLSTTAIQLKLAGYEHGYSMCETVAGRLILLSQRLNFKFCPHFKYSLSLRLSVVLPEGMGSQTLFKALEKSSALELKSHRLGSKLQNNRHQMT